MTSSASPLDAGRRTTATSADEVEQRLSTDICSGRLEPGAKLAFGMLRERYGVGISPLREALQRLVSQNLVIAESHIGFRVAPLSLDELQDVHGLRKQLCSDALRNSIANGSIAWEAQVLAASHALGRMPIPNDPYGEDADRWEESHRQLHWSLISACRSKWLLQFCRMLDAQYIRYRRIVLARNWHSKNFSERIHREHTALIDATINRHADLAVKLLVAHFDGNAQDLLRLMQEQLSPGPARTPKKAGRLATAK
ncbi:GntR family transcriptional regulator [Ramlibacter tataouinensis]|uniref:GntR family transcriptional regulator n=1 Tax=Ramlibacter tataouinensis TaxID=94132 RepID=UPI0022F3C705|nr:GntR family transcriptional regulator [Ramlibacter tataouinensis]WBY03569.1 GntR family transcriptional regulator [Ramlibacter tataouinensis]